jgi:6,7-dimethyl-8-ribityllumazine synthase
MADPLRILIVEARFYDHLADALLAGAKAVLDAAGATYEVITVPGALEIPGVIAMAEEGGHRPAGQSFDGYVALGTVIRGETYHFEIVANESARGLNDLAMSRQIAVGNGILTVENEAQALVRADASQSDKGGFAARACLAMIDIQGRLLGQVR